MSASAVRYLGVRQLAALYGIGYTAAAAFFTDPARCGLKPQIVFGPRLLPGWSPEYARRYGVAAGYLEPNGARCRRPATRLVRPADLLPDDAPPLRCLSRDEAACALARTVGRVAQLRRDGNFPDPDMFLATFPGWFPDTIRRYGVGTQRIDALSGAGVPWASIRR